MERDFVAETLPRLSERNWSLYAVLDLGTPQAGQDDFRRGRYQVILYDATAQEFQQSLGLGFDDVGVAIVRNGCSPSHPANLYQHGRSPDWVLAPR